MKSTPSELKVKT